MGDDTHIRQFLTGDLVSFEGYRYSPDYIYNDMSEYKVGIVVSTAAGGYEGSLYRVYWFKEIRTTETTAIHLKLVYTRN